MSGTSEKPGLHPRNRFRGGYDFPRLVHGTPELAAFVRPNGHGEASIDFANPAAVKTLNRALLQDAYGLRTWDIPPGFLCPPIPGRSDYLHHLADLLAGPAGGEIPRGPRVSLLDIGTGANCIYPLTGAAEYGWSFVGAEVDPAAAKWAARLAAGNAAVSGQIQIRRQASPRQCFSGVVKPGECFDATLCNPPFHASAAEAAAGALRKQRNLGAKPASPVVLNFGGQAGELWCEGGEAAFIQRMITQSLPLARRCLWFTTLVSKSAHLPRLEKAIRATGAAALRKIDMAQGSKQSRILAWTFITPPEHAAWRQERWGMA